MQNSGVIVGWGLPTTFVPFPFSHLLEFGPRPFLFYYRSMHLSEPLERRILLSASLSNGTLRVNGTSGSDTISVTLRNHKYTVTINSATSTFSPSSVRSLLVRGNAGNDKITLSGPIKANTTVNGDDGEDTIQGSNGSEQLVGGNGDDSIRGGKGNDTIRGNDGDDSLFGEIGSDSLFGSTGNDRILGGDNSDYIAGQSGDDDLNGGTGEDTIDGGDDDD